MPTTNTPLVMFNGALTFKMQGCKIELDRNSEWLDHLVYEIVNFPEVWYDLETNTYRIRGL